MYSVQCTVDKYVDFHVWFITENFPISNSKYELFKKETEKDCELQTLIKYVQNGWPQKELIPREIYFYHSINAELTYLC